tara:strand:+ start:29060 stop:29278 length:219 start_codon:yes stop_codon:yes gene_type:complete
MSKVLVIGGRGCATESLIKSLKEKYGGDVVQGEPLTQGQMPRLTKSLLELNENEWRGGSRGKGGKTKWPVRK